VVPDKHLRADTQDVVKVGIALIATMSALVLGLLIASAKSTYDTRRAQLLQVSADIILLDRALAIYGPETHDARAMLQRSVAAVIEQFWPVNRARPSAIDRTASSVESIYDNIQRLVPHNEVQRSLQAQASAITFDLGRTRVLLFAQTDSSIPAPFLVVLVFWLTAIFVSFGLFAPPKRHRRRRLPRLRHFGFRRDLSDHGARPLVRRADPDFKHAPALSACAARPIDRCPWNGLARDLRFIVLQLSGRDED